MDSDQEYDRLDVDNDFEGGEFIDGEFFYKNKRQKRAQTKEDRLYGVFAENSDEEFEGRRGLGGGGKLAPDYTRPVDFVGGGVVQHGPEDEEGQEEEEGEGQQGRGGLGSSRGGLGLGAAGPGGGEVGFRPAGKNPAASERQPPRRRVKEEEEKEEEEEVFLPTAFGRRIKQAAEQRRQHDEAAARVERAQQRSAQGRPPPAAPDAGGFEVHTKGIGAKLLGKMGWQPGRGLGKAGQGMAKPLEARLRPKGMGMGFGERREPQLAPPPAAKPVAAAAAAGGGAGAVDVRSEAPMWKKKHSEQRVRRSFRTAEEVLADAEERGAPPPPAQTIIDMRGPQTKVVTNMEHLNVAEGEEAGRVPMPELQHNVRLLVDMAEADIQRLDARLRQDRDTQAILRTEATRLQEEAKAVAAAVQRVQGVLQAVGEARAAAAEGAPLSAVRAAFAHVREQYSEEYAMYNVPAVALAATLPALAEQLAGWLPLADPAGGAAAEFAAWRPLLEGEGQRHAVLASDPLAVAGLGAGAASDPYARLVMELLLPGLRKALTNDWQPRDAAQLESFLEVWEPLLPPAVVAYAMQHLVLPRLSAAVAAWDPLHDPVLPHTWLHPWLPLLGSHMEELWPPLRHKFSAALQQWHPADSSAQAVLAPWRRVFGEREWERLLQRCVVPKLAAALSEVVVNPADQDLEAFGWVLAWADDLPPKLMASLLDAHFFPKWHAVLRHWLSNSPDFDQVTHWYLAWKGLFPDSLLDHERLRRHMNAALDAMNTAVEGKPLPATWTPAPQPLTGDGEPRPAAAPPHVYGEEYGAPHLHPPHPPGTHAAEDLTLRDLVAAFAEEAGLEFVPRAGRMHEGLQVFHFGRVSCVVDNARSVVRAQMGPARTWEAASMEGMLQEHRQREKAAAAHQRGR